MPEASEYPEDNMRNLHRPGSGIIDNFFEAIELSQKSELISKAKTIVILFSGDLNEAEEVRQILQKKDNNTCKILALDKNQPQTLNEKAHRINAKLIEADCIAPQLPQNSTDIIIAYGAEYLFIDNFQARIAFANGIANALKQGGFIHAPGFGDHVFKSDQRFIQSPGMTDIYQKI